MNEELEQQAHLLSDLGETVDASNLRLRGLRKRIREVLEATKGERQLQLIAALCVVLAQALAAGEALFKAVRGQFFSNFRVSVMLDSNGSNTTAAAGVACLFKSAGGQLAGLRAVILAGTGPVGQRAAVMLAKEGVSVSITSRTLANAQKACDHLKAGFGIDVTAVEAPDCDSRARACEGAHIVFATGAASSVLLREDDWKNNPTIRYLADSNATPPLGIEGIDMMDRGVDRHDRACWGAIGFGALKLAVHRACIAQLFEASDRVLDAEEIYATAKAMALA
jgi:hypothetical protein